MLAGGVIVSVPAPTLAAGSYPITGVTVHYYPMYTSNLSVLSDMQANYCTPENIASGGRIVAVGCSAAGLILGVLPSNQFSGYWADYVIQTSQVFVHEGAICNSSKSNCVLNKWDVYLKTRNFVQDTATWASLAGSWGPYYYGSPSVGYSARYPATTAQLVNILNGYGL